MFGGHDSGVGSDMETLGGRRDAAPWLRNEGESLQEHFGVGHYYVVSIGQVLGIQTRTWLVQVKQKKTKVTKLTVPASPGLGRISFPFPFPSVALEDGPIRCEE